MGGTRLRVLKETWLTRPRRRDPNGAFAFSIEKVLTPPGRVNTPLTGSPHV
jgi:hypothetical protein